MSERTEIVDELEDIVEDLREIRIRIQHFDDDMSRAAKGCLTMAINATEETATWLKP